MIQTAVFIAGLLLPVLAMVATSRSDEPRVPDSLPDFDRLWNYSRPEETEQKFRELLPAVEKSGNLSHLLQLQTQIARCQGLQGKFDDAQLTLDAIEKQLTDDVPTAQIRYLLERGRAFNSSNQSDKAKPLFVAAWEKASAVKEWSYAIDAAHMVAIVESDVNKQVDWNLEALALAKKESPQQKWLPSIWNNLGESYRVRKDYDKALDCFQKRAQWFHDRSKEPDIFTLKDIARMNRLLNRPAAALAIIEPIAKDLADKKQPDGYVSAEYGQCLAALGRKGEAKPHLVEAFRILSNDENMVKYESDELQQIKQLAEIRD
jgi:tetratricopeptide (TPR) repeat protein